MLDLEMHHDDILRKDLFGIQMARDQNIVTHHLKSGWLVESKYIKCLRPQNQRPQKPFDTEKRIYLVHA